MKSHFEVHLIRLTKKIDKYFQVNNIEKYTWIQDVLRAKATSEFSSLEEESLIDLSWNNALKANFDSKKKFFFFIIKRGTFFFISKRRILKG